MYTNQDTTSYLEVRGIEINDEAVYKCEITYLDVVEDCPVVQFINFTTLSKFRVAFSNKFSILITPTC